MVLFDTFAIDLRLFDSLQNEAPVLRNYYTMNKSFRRSNYNYVSLMIYITLHNNISYANHTLRTLLQIEF